MTGSTITFRRSKRRRKIAQNATPRLAEKEIRYHWWSQPSRDVSVKLIASVCTVSAKAELCTSSRPHNKPTLATTSESSQILTFPLCQLHRIYLRMRLLALDLNPEDSETLVCIVSQEDLYVSNLTELGIENYHK